MFQFYTVGITNKSALSHFTIQSIIGGIIWVIYAIIMYVLNVHKFSVLNNILITTLIIIIVTIIQIYFMSADKIIKIHFL